MLIAMAASGSTAPSCDTVLAIVALDSDAAELAAAGAALVKPPGVEITPVQLMCTGP
jgi:hypothetical protein